MVMRIINYTNVCVAQCDYCAFYKLPGAGRRLCPQPRSGLRQARRAARPRRRSGRLQRRLQPASSARLLLRPLRRHPRALRRPHRVLRPHHRRVPLPRRSREAELRRGRRALQSSRRALDHRRRLARSSPKTSARRHSKFKYTVAEYFAAQRAILEAGLKTTATMVIGFDETLDERIEHLERTRAFQDEVLIDGGLASFLCWTYKPYFTQLGGIEITTAGIPAPPRALPHLSRQHPAHPHLGAHAERTAPSKASATAQTISTSPSKTKSRRKPARPSASTSNASSTTPAPSASRPNIAT